MNRRTVRMISILTMLVLLLGLCSPAAFADGETETPADPVQAVIDQLKAIDTLQEMQDKRSEYRADGFCNLDDKSGLAAHEAQRTAYEAYISEMFAARLAAQQAYDSLTSEQKAQISSALVVKLDDSLPTVFHTKTIDVTPRNDEYSFITVDGGLGYGYEIGNHGISNILPQTFVLVDTSDGMTSWTPDGPYVCGESNYEVTYCCDIKTGLNYNTGYKRINLEDSSYYGPNAARHLRAILLNSYPYLSVDDMKARLKSKGMDSDFVDTLTRADMITAVQMAVWTYANAADGAENGLEYSATIDVTSNSGVRWFTALHDYTNELWHWLPYDRQQTFDARAAYRVNNLAHFLCTLPGEESDADDILITNIEVARAELAEHGNGYNVGVRVFLNTGSTSEKDNLKITVSSSQTQTSKTVGSEKVYEMTIYAKKGDTIKVTVDGTQYVGRNVYFYEPEGGREPSQNLVGVGEGETRVHAEQEFTFDDDDFEKGLRIYKTSDDDENGYPISDITFTIYPVTPAEGEEIGTNPTAEQLAKYAVAEKKVASVTTDETGYAYLALEDGIYLVVEEESTKVESPVAPFFITIPTTIHNVYDSEEDGSGITEVQVLDILSIYPKNTPVTPDEPEPELPPTPDDVKGRFAIEKVDETDTSIMLEGAEFKVYRPAVGGEEGITITCDGVDYIVVDTGKTLITDSNGYAKLEDLVVGTYFLVETKAPDGYNLPKEAFKVTAVSTLISAETTIITNQRGHIMPETGGMGTTPLLTAGAMLIAAALILTLARKRRAMMK